MDADSLHNYMPPNLAGSEADTKCWCHIDLQFEALGVPAVAVSVLPRDRGFSCSHCLRLHNTTGGEGERAGEGKGGGGGGRSKG